MRAQHQALGVVGGEVIAAGVGVGVVRVERALPGQRLLEISRARRSPRRAPARRGSWRRSRRRGRETAAAVAPGMARAGRRRVIVARDEIEGARAPSRSRTARRSMMPALTSAAIISPFQSASTLSSRPGPHPLVARVEQLVAQRRQPRLVVRAASARASRRLRILWPSKLPSGGHVIMAREESPSSAPSASIDLGLATRRRTCPPRLPNRRRARRQNAPSGVVISRSSQPTVSRARCANSGLPLRCISERQQLEQLRVVVEHLLEMRHQPALVDRIAREAAAEMIVDAALADALERDARRSRRSARRRCAARRARAIRTSPRCGNFGAPRRPPLTGSNMLPSCRAALSSSVDADRRPCPPAAPSRRAAPSAPRGSARSCPAPRGTAAPPRAARRRRPAGRSASLSENTCRPTPARRSASETWSAASRPARPADAARSCRSGRCRAAPRGRL